MIPGVDGVGRRTDGTLVYFVADDTCIGTMAEKAIVDSGSLGGAARRRRRREDRGGDEPGDVVMGGAAPARPLRQVRGSSSWARPATRGRWPSRSPSGSGPAASSAPAAIPTGCRRSRGRGRRDRRLSDERGHGARRWRAAAAEVDVVLDYLWGRPTRARDGGAAHRPDRTAAGRSTGSRSVRWRVRRSSCRRWRSDRRTCGCRATVKEPFRPGATLPSCRRW